MGQSTHRTLYHAVLILVISIENHILCESTTEKDRTELLEPVFNVLPNVNNRPRDKLMNTLLNVAAAKGLLPDGSRPMWPQRPAKSTQIQEPLASSNLQQSQFNPLTAHITPVLQNMATSSRSPVLFPENVQFEPQQNFITSHEHNPTQQYNGIDRRLVLTDPSQNYFEFVDQNVASQGYQTATTKFNTDQYGSYPSNTFIIPPEYLNYVQSSGFPVVFPGLDPSSSQYTMFMESSENNVLGPPIFPERIPLAPMANPPLVVSPQNGLPFNGGMPSIVIINPSQNNCQCDVPQGVKLTEIPNAIPDISDLSSPVAKSNLEVQFVPYNLELDLPVFTTLMATSDSGSLAESVPQIPSSLAFPPLMEYPPFQFPPFLPPIIIQQQGTKSKSNDLLNIFLLCRLLPFGFGGKNKCGC